MLDWPEVARFGEKMRSEARDRGYHCSRRSTGSDHVAKRTSHRITGFKERVERARDKKQSLSSAEKTPNGFEIEEGKKRREVLR